MAKYEPKMQDVTIITSVYLFSPRKWDELACVPIQRKASLISTEHVSDVDADYNPPPLPLTSLFVTIHNFKNMQKTNISWIPLLPHFYHTSTTLLPHFYHTSIMIHGDYRSQCHWFSGWFHFPLSINSFMSHLFPIYSPPDLLNRDTSSKWNLTQAMYRKCFEHFIELKKIYI